MNSFEKVANLLGKSSLIVIDESETKLEESSCNYEVGIYPREDDDEAEYAVYCKKTRTWSDFQGSVSKKAKETAQKIANEHNKVIKEAKEEKEYLDTFSEVMKALKDGKKVFWKNEGYTVKDESKTHKKPYLLVIWNYKGSDENSVGCTESNFKDNFGPNEFYAVSGKGLEEAVKQDKEEKLTFKTPIEVFEWIVKEHQYLYARKLQDGTYEGTTDKPSNVKKGGWILVDATSANMVMQVFKKLNDENKAKLEKFDIEKIVSIVYKLLK